MSEGRTNEIRWLIVLGCGVLAALLVVAAKVVGGVV